MLNERKKAIGAVVGVALGAAFALLCPDVGLPEQGVRCLGVLIGAIVWWVAGVLPEYATGLVMVVLFCVLAGVGTTTSFSGFASETWWLLVGAYGLGAGMKISGLMKRMANAITRAFPNTFAAQAAGLIAAGTLIGPLVPSLAAKAAILTPVSMSVGDALGYERGGKQMQGLFLAVFTGMRNIGPAAVSASILGYALMAVYPADVRAQFDMLHWFLAALPWFAFVTLANYALIVVLYRPRGEAKRAAFSPGQAVSSAEPASAPAAAPAVPAARERTPLSRQEKQMCAIIVVTVALWVLEPLHGIGSHVIALAAFTCTVACGILGPRGFRESIGWESLVFIGTMFGLANVFVETGIQDWIVAVARPAFEALAASPVLFVLGVGVMTIAMRFLVVSEVAYVNIVMAFLVPLAAQLGINPWVVGFAIYATVSPWFAIYQNSIYLTSLYSVDAQMARHADLVKYCAPYLAICLAGLAVSVPYWQWLGYM